MGHNPHHKQQLLRMGLTPESLFMCGFFTLCAPKQVCEVLCSGVRRDDTDRGAHVRQ